ncbi:hypothetical protein SELMODRAFT_403051 [Selaginella moellendorffii]|uniref:Protein kinase domain-containing protein n=1 Tax=Selaginella moellendorffii TaxID=88036 RepID=D8QNW6_SELML|nr:hypothetical protein SELMODRAFT_403051 [Selaginella moellendorffii]
MAVSLFSLLRTHIPSPGFTGSSPLCDSLIGEHTPSGAYKVWESFASELQLFLSALYSQPDSAPVFTHPHPLVGAETTNREEASARLYASLVIPVQELSAEYHRRFQVGGGLHLTHIEAAFVMYGNADESTSQPPNAFAANTLRGFFVLEPDVLLQGLTVSGGDAHKIFARAAGYLYYNRSGLSREEDVFQVSDHVVFDMNSPPHGARSPTLFEALFFLMHLMFQKSNLPRPQQRLDQPFPRRKRIKYNSAGPSTVNARSRIHKEQAVDLRIQMSELCRSMNFSFKDIEDIVTLQLSDLKLSSWRQIHSGEQVSVFQGRFKGEKAVFKSVDVCKAPDKLRKMVREVWVMARLKSLQGDVIPRLYASGFLDGGIWLTIMQDIGGTSIDKNYEELYKDSYLTAAKSALSVIHRANASHGRVESSNIIVGEGGKVMWIDLEAACFFGSDGDADDLLHFVREDLKQIPVCRSN